MSVNKVTLLGRLGANPEMRTTNTGMSVANFTLATSENWTDKGGQRQERTEWHRIVVWGKLAELCGQYLSKGRQVYLEGKLQTRQWDDKEGNKRYTTEVVGSTVQFLGGPNAATGQNQYAPEAGAESGATAAAPVMAEPTFTEDDIPF